MCVNNPSFKHSHVINENLVGVEKQKPKLKLDKPIFLGKSIVLKFRIFCYPTLRFEESLSKRMHQINATPGIQHSGTPTNQKEVHTVHTTSLPASCNPEHRTHGDTGTSQQTLWVPPPLNSKAKHPDTGVPWGGGRGGGGLKARMLQKMMSLSHYQFRGPSASAQVSHFLLSNAAL